ncbi:MAG TPA: hypothetical protein VMH80_22205 [Bryobacteraceae bacterium]|nr:hypothetical protein [Bryobacteraceae bacterium]
MFDSRSNVCNKVARMVMAIVPLIAIGGLPKPADAQIDPPAVFTAASISLGQTFGVNIVNLGGPSTVPPGPCNVQITFVNANGQTVKSSSLSIDVGHIAWATVNFLEASQARVTAVADSPLRQVLRPVISVVPPDPCRVVMSAEIYETLTGRTNLYLPAVQLPMEQSTTSTNGQ